MIKFGKSVEINITNSQVHGDVIGGDKIVTVNIHPDKLTSEEALFDVSPPTRKGTISTGITGDQGTTAFGRKLAGSSPCAEAGGRE